MSETEKNELTDLSEADKEEMLRDMLLLRRAVKNFHGYTPYLEQALGMYLLGKDTGWRPIYLMNDMKAIRRSEGILGVKLKDCLPEVGRFAQRSLAYRTLTKIEDFWKAVRGQIAGARSGEFLPD